MSNIPCTVYLSSRTSSTRRLNKSTAPIIVTTLCHHAGQHQRAATMHPALIPEKHPMCGKFMEALVQCRKEHPYSKFWGACSDITWELSNCLKHEKKVVREPRQKRYHERWSAKREEDAARLEALRQQQREQQQQQGGTAAGPGAGAVDVGDDDD